MSEDSAVQNTPPTRPGQPPSATRAGRPNQPIITYGPVADLAHALRALRDRAGNPTFEAMEKRVENALPRSRSASSLSTAANGRQLPTEDAVRAFALACKASEPETQALLVQRELARATLDRFLQDLSAARTAEDLRHALVALVHEHIPATEAPHLTEAVAMRLARVRDRKFDKKWAVTALPAERIAKELGGTSPLTEEMVTNVVFACGGLLDAMKHWRDAWQGLAASPPDPRPGGLRRRWVLAGASLAAVGAVGAVAETVRRATTSASPRGVMSPIRTVVSPRRPTARGELLALRDHVQTLSEPLGSGRFTYTRIEVWSWEDPPGEPEHAETSQVERLWWADDLSGVREFISIVKGRPVKTTSQTYERGKAPIVIPRPSSDPAKLARQIRGEYPPEAGAAGPLRAIAAVYGCHVLAPVQRAATHHVLAHTEGLRYEGVLPGNQLTIYAETGGTGSRLDHDVLVFDTATGALLRHDIVTVRRRDGQPAREQTSRVEFLEHRRTDSVD